MSADFTIVVGTRPELIKLTPVIWEAQKRNLKIETIISGQHKANLLSPLLDFFEIEPTVVLPEIDAQGDLNRLSAILLENLSHYRPGKFVVSQGDTTTALVSALWGFHAKSKVVHVEAGLRTFDTQSPFPEEANRQLISKIADFHFAPTQSAVNNLLQEGVGSKSIFRVGNTGIDTLLSTIEKLEDDSHESKELTRILNFVDDRPMVLVTTHRRENQGEPLKRILRAIQIIADEHPEIVVVLPVHPNPNVRKPVEETLGGYENILLVAPQSYPDFVGLMDRASVLLSDSGGVQEEGPSLDKPIVVMRESTERPEAVSSGYASLVGANLNLIVDKVKEGLLDGCQGRGGNPYGDGLASQRILDNLLTPNSRIEYFCENHRETFDSKRKRDASKLMEAPPALYHS